MNGGIGFKSEGRASVFIDQAGGSIKLFRFKILELSVDLGLSFLLDAPNSADAFSLAHHLKFPHFF